jgi:hypothetical protein
MKNKIQEFVNEGFNKLVEQYGFKKGREHKDEQSYSVEFRSNQIIIQIVEYHRELYTYILQRTDREKGAELFNLLGYLKRGSTDIPLSNYYREEKNLEDSLKKQVVYISRTILENLELINIFFKSEKFDYELTELIKYVIAQNPRLYGTSRNNAKPK